MREVEVIVNEDAEKVSVHDLFTFSVKYHNLSSTSDTIPERERVIIHWSTTGIWLIDDNELLIEEDSSWRDVSKELSFFLEWQNPDSTHSPISLRMLFYAIVDSLKHDYWKTPFGAYQEHSIRISEIAQHYSRKVIKEGQKSIKDEHNVVIPKKLKPTPAEKMKRGLEAWDRLESLKAKGNTSPDPRQAAIDKREKDEKVTSVTSDKPSISMERSLFSHKKWNELTADEKSYAALDGLSEEDMQKFWDGADPLTREIILHC